MGYLEIRKKQLLKKTTKPNLEELIAIHKFKPQMEVSGYLPYAFSNYEMLIKEAEDYYQAEVEKKVVFDLKYFSQLTHWFDETRLTDKLEYFRRLFIFEYMDFIYQQNNSES